MPSNTTCVSDNFNALRLCLHFMLLVIKVFAFIQGDHIKGISGLLRLFWCNITHGHVHRNWGFFPRIFICIFLYNNVCKNDFSIIRDVNLYFDEKNDFKFWPCKSRLWYFSSKNCTSESCVEQSDAVTWVCTHDTRYWFNFDEKRFPWQLTWCWIIYV